MTNLQADEQFDPSAEPNAGMTGDTAGSPDMLAVALRAKWWLVAGLAAGLVAGELLYLKLGPTYEAKAQILVAKRLTAPIADDEESEGLGDRGEHVALIMSPLIVGEAVKKYQLDKLPSLVEEEEPVQAILDDLRVKRSAGEDRSVLNVLDVSYRSGRGPDAEKIVQGVIDAYRDYLQATREEYYVEAVKLIGQSSQDLLKQVREKERAYVAFRDQAPHFFHNTPGAEGGAGENTNVQQERLFAIEAEQRANLLKRAEIHSRINALNQALARGESRPALEVLIRRFLSTEGGQAATAAAQGPTQVNTLQDQLLGLILEEQKLTRDYGRDHPDVQAVRQSIQTIRQLYRQQGLTFPEFDKAIAGATGAAPGTKPPTTEPEDFVTVYLKSLDQQLNELEFRDKELAKLFADADREAKKFARFQFEDASRNDEIMRLKELSAAVVTKLSKMDLGKENGGYSLKQLAPARAEVLVKRQLQIVGLMAGMGLALAFGLFYLRALRDTTFKTVDDLRREFTFPVIGQVPLFNPAALSAAARGHSLLSPTLYFMHSPSSPEAEAYRGLRTALYFCTHGEGHKVIQISSPEPQDGKTTLAANLALAMAQSGKRVLLIDADLRCPKVHILFGMRQEIGLSDIISGEVEPELALRDTDQPGLNLICAGLTPANPAEMLGGSRFATLLAAARQEYDFVIVDTPPFLAVSDPCVVAPQTDGVLLVLRLAKNRRTAVRDTCDLMTTNGIRLLGVAVNGVAASKQYGYGYGYGGAATKARSTPAGLVPAGQS